MRDERHNISPSQPKQADKSCETCINNYLLEICSSKCDAFHKYYYPKSPQSEKCKGCPEKPNPTTRRACAKEEADWLEKWLSRATIHDDKGPFMQDIGKHIAALRAGKGE